MRGLFYSLLLIGAVAVATESMPEFPVNRVQDYPTLQTWVHQAPYTTASFIMERTLPSGRVLRSRGSFEFRLGQGMMWRTEHPVRNTMIISETALSQYDAKGKELRRIDLQGVPSGRMTAAFTQKLNPAFLKQMERIFDITCRTDVDKHLLVVGLKARHSSNDLKWMLLQIQRGMLQQVYYESGRQGGTKVTFSNIKNSDQVPTEAFRIVR